MNSDVSHAKMPLKLADATEIGSVYNFHVSQSMVVTRLRLHGESLQYIGTEFPSEFDSKKN